MKVVIFLALALTCVFVIACSGQGDGSKEEPDNDHAMGAVWAMVYPTALVFELADHTYITGRGEDGNSYDWLCFGEKTGGEELSGTRTDVAADLTTVGFMASEAPCKWPIEYYLRIGVCHQCANRGLYYTGKTVAASEGYDFFVSLYGTYGDESVAEYHNFSMQNCIDSAPVWQGLPPAAGAQKNMASPEDRIQDTEAGLYQEYMRKKNVRALEISDGDLFDQYLDALFETRIREKLGREFPARVIAELVDIRNRYRREKKSLDREALAGGSPGRTFPEGYAALFNRLADEYKAMLTPREYETLFNLDYARDIDLNSILPR